MFWVIFGIIILVSVFGPVVLYAILCLPDMLEVANDFLYKVQVQFPQNNLTAMFLILMVLALMFLTIGCFEIGFFGAPLELKKRRKYNEEIRPIYTEEGLEDLAKQGRYARIVFFICCFILGFIVTHSV